MGRTGKLGVNQRKVGERSASTQLLKTIQTDRQTDKNTDRQDERTIIGEGVSFAEDFSRKIASAFLRS